MNNLESTPKRELRAPPLHSVESSPTPILQMNHVDIGYPGNPILQDINIDINPGEYIGIIGPNGSGKTTFLRTLLGLLNPMSGTITINNGAEKNHSKHQIGYVPQSTKIPRNFPLNVKETVLMGLYGQIGLLHRPKPQDKKAAEKALHMVHLWKFRNRPIGHLSGGEQQKAIIARALVSNAKILLLDEPTSSLDFQMTKSVFELVGELNQKYHYTIVIVHHNIELIRDNCKRLLIFHKKIRYDGPPQNEFADKIIDIAYRP